MAPRVRRTKTVEVVPDGDGRFRFEARLTDEAWGGEFGGPEQTTIHDIVLTGRLEGPDLTLIELTMTPLRLPYEQCPRIAPACQSLVGSTLRHGWRRAVLSHLGGSRGCTHTTTLLLGLSEVTTQVIFLEMNAVTAYTPTTRNDGSWMTSGLEIAPGLVDVCHSLTRTGLVLAPLLERSDMVNTTAETTNDSV